MVFLTDVREWIKTFGLFQGYWIGRLSAKKDNTLGIYPLRNSPARREVFSGSAKSYDVTGINFLIHGSNNKDETDSVCYAIRSNSEVTSMLHQTGIDKNHDETTTCIHRKW